MKKFLVILIMVLVPTAQALGFGYSQEQPDSQSAYSYDSATSEEMLSAVNQASAKVDAISRKLEKQNVAQKEMNGVVMTLANNQGKMATELGKINDKVDETKSALHAEAKGLGEQATNNAWLNGGLIALAVIILGVLGYWGFLRIRRNINLRTCQIGDAVENVLKAVNDGFAAAPAQISEAVHAFFNCAPLDFNVAGYNVIFNQSAEATGRKVYQVPFVDADVDPSITVATWSMHEVCDRNRALDSFKRTMRDHFSGKLAEQAKAGSVSAKLCIKLITSLIATKQLVITKL